MPLFSFENMTFMEEDQSNLQTCLAFKFLLDKYDVIRLSESLRTRLKLTQGPGDEFDALVIVQNGGKPT